MAWGEEHSIKQQHKGWGGGWEGGGMVWGGGWEGGGMVGEAVPVTHRELTCPVL